MHSTNIGPAPAVLIYADTQALANLKSSPLYSQEDCSGTRHGYFSFSWSALGIALGSPVKGLRSQCRKCLSTGSRELHPAEIKNLARVS